MKTIIKATLLLLIIGLAVSCSNPRKCGNKKGIRTPMGVM